MDLYKLLEENHIILNGDKFTLSSGATSYYYVDIKRTISIPTLFKKIIFALSDKIKRIPDIQEYAIMGVPYSGIPFASVLGYKLDIPQLLLRKDTKTHGTKKRIEGHVIGKKLILIEDVMSTGASIIDTIKYLNISGYTVSHVFTIFQRGPID